MFWDSIRSDIRYTIRQAVQAPLFTFLAVIALALGIGANSAIFTVVQGVLLQPLPYHDPGQLVTVWSHNTAENKPENPISPANFVDLRRRSATLDGLEGYFSFVTNTQIVTDARAGNRGDVLCEPGPVPTARAHGAPRPRASARRRRGHRGDPQPRLLAAALRRRSRRRRVRRCSSRMASPRRSSASCRPSSCSRTRGWWARPASRARWTWTRGRRW